MSRILSFEDGKIIYLKGKQGENSVQIRDWVSRPLPDDIMENGQIRDDDAFCEILQGFVRKNNFDKKDCSVVIDHHNALLRELTLPAAKDKEMYGIVQNEMLYALGNMDEYTVDYVQLETVEGGSQVRVLAMALQNQLIENLLSAAARCGLKVESIDLGFNALAKLTRAAYPQYLVAVLLEITESCINIYLIEDGYCFLCRNVRLNINTFAQSETLDVMAEEIADHVGRVLQFQHSRSREHDIETLLLLCDRPEANEMLEMLSRNISIPCAAFDWGGVVKSKTSVLPEAALCAKGAGGLLKKKK